VRNSDNHVAVQAAVPRFCHYQQVCVCVCVCVSVCACVFCVGRV